MINLGLAAIGLAASFAIVVELIGSICRYIQCRRKRPGDKVIARLKNMPLVVAWDDQPNTEPTIGIDAGSDYIIPLEVGKIPDAVDPMPYDHKIHLKDFNLAVWLEQKNVNEKRTAKNIMQ